MIPVENITLEAMDHTGTFDPYLCTQWQEKCRQRVAQRSEIRRGRGRPRTRKPFGFRNGNRMTLIDGRHIMSVAVASREGVYAIVELVRDPDLPLRDRILLSHTVDDAVAMRRAHFGETAAKALAYLTDTVRQYHCGKSRGKALVGRPYFDSRRREALALCRSLRYSTL